MAFFVRGFIIATEMKVGQWYEADDCAGSDSDDGIGGGGDGGGYGDGGMVMINYFKTKIV